MSMLKTRFFRLLLGVLLVDTVLSMSVDGARFPDAVEKKIVLTGGSAVAIAELFGLSASGMSSVSLQLGRADAWAVYLLKQDTKNKLWNDKSGAPPRFNKVVFSTFPRFSLAISPYWLDLATRGPQPRVGFYSFTSPFIPEKLDMPGPWTQLVHRLKRESGWNTQERRQFQRCFTSPEGIELCVQVYGAKDYTNNRERNGYLVVVEAHVK